MNYDSLMDKWGAECDERSRVYIEAHKDDPCECCGTREGVKVIPYGSLAKLTSICGPCRKRAQEDAKLWKDGFNTEKTTRAGGLVEVEIDVWVRGLPHFAKAKRRTGQ